MLAFVAVASMAMQGSQRASLTPPEVVGAAGGQIPATPAAPSINSPEIPNSSGLTEIQTVAEMPFVPEPMTQAPVDHDGAMVEAASVRVREVGGVLSEMEMVAVLTIAGWPEALHAEALTVAWCESKFSIDGKGDISNHPDQLGSPMSRGLFQMGVAGWRWVEGRWQWWNGWFRYFGYSDDDAYDPVKNATVARMAYERSGWGPWSCRLQ